MVGGSAGPWAGKRRCRVRFPVRAPALFFPQNAGKVRIWGVVWGWSGGGPGVVWRSSGGGLEVVRGSFLGDFWVVLGPLWHHFGINLGWFGGGLGKVLGQYFGREKKVLGMTWEPVQNAYQASNNMSDPSPGPNLENPKIRIFGIFWNSRSTAPGGLYVILVSWTSIVGSWPYILGYWAYMLASWTSTSGSWT